MRPQQLALVALVLFATSIVACTRREAGTTSAPPAVNVVGPTAVSNSAEPMRVAPAEPGDRNASFAFPPRDQSFRFRAFDLESKYRDGLRRGAAIPPNEVDAWQARDRTAATPYPATCPRVTARRTGVTARQNRG